MKKTITLFLILAAVGFVRAADTYTTYYNLRMPDLDIEDEDTPWGEKYNNNMLLIDAAVNAITSSTTTVAALGVSTATNATNIAAIAVSTGTQADRIEAVAVSTGVNTAAIALKVAKAGDTMTGGLIVSSNVSAGYYQVLGSTVLAISNTSTIKLGVTAGKVNTGGTNVFLGYEAALGNTSGEGNITIGSGAGRNGASGSYNTIMGAGAGWANTGAFNTFLGFQTGQAKTTGDYNILIGASIDAPAATTANHLNIGGLITGTVAGSSVTVQGDLWAGQFSPKQVTAASIGALVPTGLGNIVMCVDCSNIYTVCASTSATVRGSWIISGSVGAGHCQ